MKKIVLVALVVIMVATMSFAFCACKDENKLIGFDTEVAQAVCDKLGVKAEFQEIDWETKEVELNAKNIDCIWNGMTITEERADSMSLSNPYLRNKQVGVVRVGDESKYDLANPGEYTYIAESGSAGYELLEDKGVTAIGASAQKDIFTEILSQTADYGVMDSIMANYYINMEGSTYNGKLAIVEIEGADTESYGIGFRKADTYLTYKINKALYELQEAGKIAEIAEKYGLTSELVTFVNPEDPATDADTSSWDYIKERGKLIVGYTLFAPIAYYEE